MRVSTCPLAIGFKTSKVVKYDGHGDPIAHLRDIVINKEEPGTKKNCSWLILERALLRSPHSGSSIKNSLTGCVGQFCQGLFEIISIQYRHCAKP